MDYLIISKREFSKNNLSDVINNYLTDYIKDTKTIVFDIHNTIEYGDKQIDKTIFNFIKNNYKKLNIILLSYDGNEERIKHNNNILNDYSDIFKEIPKIFIKKRKKHFIIMYIYKLILTKFNSKHKMMFVDDNYRNITDAYKLKNIRDFQVVHYIAHSNKENNNTEAQSDISNIINQFSS